MSKINKLKDIIIVFASLFMVISILSVFQDTSYRCSTPTNTPYHPSLYPIVIIVIIVGTIIFVFHKYIDKEETNRLSEREGSETN